MPDAEPQVALTAIETVLLDRLVPDRKPNPSGIRDLSSYIRKIARLGGWLARAGDPLPGDTVLWRGMVRLADIVLGSTPHSEMWVISRFTRHLQAVARSLAGTWLAPWPATRAHSGPPP